MAPKPWPVQLAALADLDRAGRFEELEQALARLPGDGPAAAAGDLAYWRGKVQVVAGRFALALAPLALAVRLQPTRAHAQYLLGVALAREELRCDAVQLLQRALALQPDLSAAALELGQLWLALGNPQAARRVLEQGLAHAPADPALNTWFWRARVREASVEQAPPLLAQALAALQRPADDLLVEWLQIAAGLLLGGQWDLARVWLDALSTPGPSLEACSHPIPRRLALVFRLGLELLEPSAVAAGTVAAELRSLLWLPPAEQERQLWGAWMEPWLEIQRGRLSPAVDEPAALALLAEAVAVLDPAGGHTRAGRLRWLRNPPLEPLERHGHDLDQLLQHWKALLAEDDGSLRAQRPALERALEQLSALVLHRPNQLVLHPDPALMQPALALREQGMELLLRANRRLSALCTPRRRRSAPCRRWLLLASDDLPQCFLYRVQQKREHLEALGAECRILRIDELQSWAWSEQLLWADALIVCRLPALQPVLRAITAAQRAGLPVLYDIDDLIVDPAHCPPPLATYAGSLQPELHRRFHLDVPLFAEAMAACDGAIVSTRALADRWRELQRSRGRGQPVWVLPNLAPPALVQALRPPRATVPGEPLRLVVASGTTAHKQSWQEELAPALAVLLERHPQLRLDLLGHLQLPLVLQPLAERIRCRPFCDYPTYLEQLGEADIGLVVLEDGLFTDAKSAIRWMEFSYLGLAAVLSPTRTYRELLHDGEHALFARGTDAWITRIEALIQDPQERLALARRAQAHATRELNPDQAEAFWRPWLEGGSPLGAAAVASGPRLLLKPPRRRLLVANVFFAPQSIGGATRVVQDQVAALLEHAADRYAITVLCTDHDPWQRDDRIAVDCHDWHGARVVRLALPPRSWRLHHDATVEAFCRWWLPQEGFELIHSHCVQVLSTAPLLVARQLGIPYAITLHDGWWLSPRQFLTTASGQPVNLADPLSHYDAPERQPPELLEADRQRCRDLEAVLAGAAARLAVSEPFAELHRQAGIADVEVMENRWQPMAAARRRPRQPEEPLRACFVGGMSLHKGLAVLQAALLQADLPSPGLRLTLVDASLEADQQLHVHWGRTPVQLVPAIPMAAMAAFYAEHDLLIAPSIWPESYGLVTREALSAGLWVVASEIGALAEPIRHGLNGHRIPPRDPAALAAVLEQLCAKPPQPQPLLAFPAVERPLHQELDALYRRLLADPPP